MRLRCPSLLRSPCALKPIVLAAALGVALAVPAAGDRDADRRFADAGPEPQLARILNEVRHQRLDSALAMADELTRDFPTFRLGHLIKGDLLLARGKGLRQFGGGAGAVGGGQLADLQSEAIARLAGWEIKPPAEQMPRQLLSLSARHKNAILVDTKVSRLYLVANDGPTPRIVADYYVSQGRAGADKRREGDLRTPVGLYHVTSYLPPAKLTDFYGSGAFPINYPNDWDQRQGRTGHGIWLHGTPPDTYSRPPRASEGCVVLSNPDFEALSASIETGHTPVVIAHGLDWLPVAEWAKERDELRATIDQWRRDWESRNVDRYLRHYAASFRTDDQNRESFERNKRLVNEGKAWIRVAVSDLDLLANPGTERFVVATFEQDYRSNNLSNQMHKEQHWMRIDGRWQIVYEGNA